MINNWLSCLLPKKLNNCHILDAVQILKIRPQALTFTYFFECA